MSNDIVEIGTDFNSKWEFINGDLVLVNGNDNVIQSIANRLNTKLNSLNIYYENYGSYVHSFFGWKSNEETLNFMKIEIVNALEQDPRLENVEVDLSYANTNEVVGQLHLTLFDDSDLTLSMVLNNIEVELTEEEEEDYGD